MSDDVFGSSRDLPPALLYKYRPVDGPAGDRLRQIIVQNELWAASPAEFNDPYDCFPRIDGTGTDEERNVFLEAFIARRIEQVPPAQRVKFARKLRSEFTIAAHDRDALPQQTTAWRDTVASIGLVSLSEDPTSLPLWAHYAANHTGVCLAFATYQMPLNLAHRVIYQEERPTFRFLDPDRSGLMHRVLLRKAADWKYEREWRFFETGLLGPRPISSSALRWVILGARITAGHEDLVRRMISLRIGRVELKRATVDNDRYRMEIVAA